MGKDGKKRENAALLAGFLLLLATVLSVSVLRSAEKDVTRGGGDLRIVEVMTDNASAFVNADGLTMDYCVIENAGQQRVNLAGWGISDRMYEIRCVLPTVEVDAGGRVFVFFPGKGEAAGKRETYAGFGLDASGETLALFHPGGEIVQHIDIPALSKNEVYALNDGTWCVSEAHSYRPDAAYAGGSDGGIVISEVLTANVSYRQGEGAEGIDLIEIHNASDAAVDLSRYALSDSLDHPERFAFPEGSMLEPDGYALVLCGAQEGVPGRAYANLQFALNAAGETLYLYDKQAGKICDMVILPALEADCSYARMGDTWSEEFSPTPGFSNDAQGLAALDAQLRSVNASGIFISEVCASNLSVDLPGVKGHYDFIELCNVGQEMVDLCGYTLSDNPKQPRKWVLDGLTIPAGETLLIYCEPENVGMDTDTVLYAGFALNAGSCSVYLHDPQGKLLDRVRAGTCFADTSYGRTPGKAGLYVYDAPTPGALNAGGFPGYSGMPAVSLPGGIYERPVTVALSAPGGAQIIYTLDGCDPAFSGTLYTGPIVLEETAVLRACALEEGLAPSPVLTQTYFISVYHSLPIVSLSTEPDNLWNEEEGMLADGPNLNRETQSRPWLEATYSKKKRNVGYIEYYDETGVQQLSQGMIFHCMGQFSLDMPQKSFSVEANPQFGSDAFEYAAFADRPFERYAAFALRNGGQDGLYTRVLDGLQARLVDQAGSSVITQATKPVVVYLNGQYWGHYNLRERVGVEMIAQHEGWTDPQHIDLLEGSGIVNSGSGAAYRELVSYVESHDLAADADALKYVLSQVDVDNMIDYFFFEMFFGNEDSGNIRFYRNAVQGDGKWRYVLYDLDWGLFHSAYGGPAHVLNPEGMGAHKITSNAILIALLDVPQIKERFLMRGGELFTSVLTTQNMIALLEEMIGEIEPEMPMHFERWAAQMFPQLSADQPRNPEGAYLYWQERVARAKNVMKKRPVIFYDMVMDAFDLTQEEMRRYFGEPPVMPADAV